MLYPAQTSSRFVENLSGIWDFKLDDGTGFDQKWYERPLEDATTMAVPAAYNDLKEGVEFRDHYGWVFYQHNIAVPQFVMSQRVMLRFSSVTHHARVYLNGELICEHEGGFLPFEVQLNDHLKPGDNLLTVAVSNIIDYNTLPVGGKGNMMGGLMGGMMGDTGESKPRNNPNFDFFNYAGILRPCYIYTTPEAHIEDVELVPAVDGTTATISYKVEAVGEGVAASHAVDDGLDMMHSRVNKLAIAHHEVPGQVVGAARMHHATRRVHRLETRRRSEDLPVRNGERFLRPVRALKLQHALHIADTRRENRDVR